MPKLLFVCSRNQRRSLTAEWLYKGFDDYEVRSGGTESGTRERVKAEDIEWADFIFAMERMHVERLQKMFKDSLAGKRLICLQIPDVYGCMSPELIKALKEKLSLYVDVPRR